MARDLLFDHGNARFSCRMSAVIIQDGRILLQCPVGTQDYAFIGGHVAFGETARETLVREIREELHTDAQIGRLIAVGEVFIDWGRCPDGSARHCHQLGMYFLATVDERQLPDRERFFGYDEAGGVKYAIEYLWIPLDKLPELTVYPPEVARLCHPASPLHQGQGDVTHFVYSELPPDVRWPD